MRAAYSKLGNMSSSEISNGFPHLTEEQRRRALELRSRIDLLQAELDTLLRPRANEQGPIDLRASGIETSQAADLRARLRTFAEDWERPEAAVYDEPTPR